MERSSRRVAKEKWSASRAVKVVSLANETNIRADRVDKRQERAARGEAERRRAEKRGAASSVPALKLTKEFRFLYNRFNLIPRALLDRSGEDVSGERISISEVSDSPGLPLARSSFYSFLHARSFILQFGSPFFSSLLLLTAAVRARNSEESIFRYRRVGDETRQAPTIISIVKIVFVLLS